jgi:hypothetical protein
MSEENTPPVTQPEFAEVTKVCPPGASAPKAKRAKAVAKLYYVTNGLEAECEGLPYPHFVIVGGSEKGFRTKEEMAKFVKTLPAGEYTPISVPSKTISIVETTRVSIKGI